MNSNFNKDLSREELLGKYLDGIYSDTLKDFNIERISDIDLQHRGVDIIISRSGNNYHIDEKAQLDYTGHDLPTFAFEITYLKHGEQKLGWLFDAHKVTDKYFVITGIFLNTPNDFNKGFKSCKITSVDRTRLVRLLSTKGLEIQRILEINQELRSGSREGSIAVKELDSRSEGNFYFSKSNKAEQPINIVLKLDYLIKNGVAKKVH